MTSVEIRRLPRGANSRGGQCGGRGTARWRRGGGRGLPYWHKPNVQHITGGREPDASPTRQTVLAVAGRQDEHSRRTLTVAGHGLAGGASRHRSGLPHVPTQNPANEGGDAAGGIRTFQVAAERRGENDEARGVRSVNLASASPARAHLGAATGAATPKRFQGKQSAGSLTLGKCRPRGAGAPRVSDKSFDQSCGYYARAVFLSSRSPLGHPVLRHRDLRHRDAAVPSGRPPRSGARDSTTPDLRHTGPGDTCAATGTA